MREDARTPALTDPGFLIRILDLALTALLGLWLFNLIRGTRAARLVFGVVILYGGYAATRFFDLTILSRVLGTAALAGTVALVVIFSPELRRGLKRLGRVGSLSWLFRSPPSTLDRSTRHLARASAAIAGAKHGGLIVVQRESGLVGVAETGVPLHADLTSELLLALFQPPGPLHDGAVIVRDEQIVVGGVVMPLSETTSVGGVRLGTRHRAALGITEQSDALAIVISEERGHISLAEHGRFVRNLNEERLRDLLRARLAISPMTDEARRWSLVRIGGRWRSRTGRH